MKERLLKYLACPACQSDVALRDGAERDGAEIMAGQLNCTGCGREYPIVGGIPRFANLAEDLVCVHGCSVVPVNRRKVLALRWEEF